MSQTTIAVIVVVVVVAVIIIAVIAVVAWQRSRLCTRLGPEYDRAVDERGSTVAAERELLGRVLGHYRAAHEASDRQARREATTEDLRQNDGALSLRAGHRAITR